MRRRDLDTGAPFTALAQTAADALGLVSGERGRRVLPIALDRLG